MKNISMEEQLRKIIQENTEEDGQGYGFFGEEEVIEFVRSFYQEYIKEIRRNFIKIAIKGVHDEDELKGAMLYVRFLDYIDSLLSLEKEEHGK